MRSSVPFLAHCESRLTFCLISFGKEFTSAVEQKQIAQQDAERAKFVVEKAEQERQASVIRAEGQAEAANTISKALSKAGDAFVQFKKIETSREIGMSIPFTAFLADQLTIVLEQPTLFPRTRTSVMSPQPMATCFCKSLLNNNKLRNESSEDGDLGHIRICSPVMYEANLPVKHL